MGSVGELNAEEAIFSVPPAHTCPSKTTGAEVVSSDWHDARSTSTSESRWRISDSTQPLAPPPLSRGG